MDARQMLEELNKKIYNAERALDKWVGSDRAEVIRKELGRLYAQRANLPAEIRHQDNIDKTIDNLKASVDRLHKFPDIAINRQDVEKYAGKLLELGILQADIDVIVGDVLEEKSEEKSTLAPEDAQKLLRQLTDNVKAYLDDLSFKAELDPSYTMPDDVLVDIQSWENNNPDKPLNSVQNKILRTINDLQAGQVSESDIHTAIRSGQN